MSGLRGWARAYRTPVWLTGLFIVLLAVFAVTPDPTTTASLEIEPTAEPTPGPRSCAVCPIDQTCDPDTGQCMFVDHTPFPCVKSAKFDDKAGFCLPQGAPPAPAVTQAPDARFEFPGGIGGDRRRRQDRQRGQDLPGFGD